MRAFTMNLLNYNANTAFPLGLLALQKQVDLRAELTRYSQGINQAPVHVAGFTEVFVAGNAFPGNVQNALNDLADALLIPVNNHNRHIAVIRCGYSALQPNGNEVVAIVLDGNATAVQHHIYWFTPGGNPNQMSIVNIGNYTAYLQQYYAWTPDYRYVVGVDFSLNGVDYNIAFFHNRQPGSNEQGVGMIFARNLVHQNQNLLLGGDFNTGPLCANANPCVAGYHHQTTYYSTLNNTTVASNYDWWMSCNTFMVNGIAAQCDATPNVPLSIPPAINAGNVPPPIVTGSDHRGVGISIA